MEAAQAFRETPRFAWHGIAVDVPREWELGAWDGDWQAGRAELDDGVRVCLRVHWCHAGAEARAGVEHFLERVLGSQSARVETTTGVHFPAAFQDGKERLAFRRGEPDPVTGAAWYCTICERLVAVEAAAAAEEFENMLSSVQCHPRGPHVPWSVYGFAFSTPRSYNLTRPDLRPGRLMFSFTGAGGWFVIERWSRAAHLLSQITLEQWPAEWLRLWKSRQISGAESRRVRNDPEPVAGFSAEAAPERWFGASGKAQPVAGWVRHVTSADKLVAVAGNVSDPGLLESIALSAECE